MRNETRIMSRENSRRLFCHSTDSLAKVHFRGNAPVRPKSILRRARATTAQTIINRASCRVESPRSAFAGCSLANSARDRRFARRTSERHACAARDDRARQGGDRTIGSVARDRRGASNHDTRLSTMPRARIHRAQLPARDRPLRSSPTESDCTRRSPRA